MNKEKDDLIKFVVWRYGNPDWPQIMCASTHQEAARLYARSQTQNDKSPHSLTKVAVAHCKGGTVLVFNVQIDIIFAKNEEGIE